LTQLALGLAECLRLSPRRRSWSVLPRPTRPRGLSGL